MKKNILIIDNYDSFTYNIVALAKKFAEVTVIRNDEIDLNSVVNFNKIILSPGPGLPKDAGLMPDLIARFHNQKSILGICLGHQAIGQFYGAELINNSQVMHGKQSTIKIIKDSYLTTGLASSFLAGRYHSWSLDEKLHNELELLMTSEDGTVMGIKHKQHDVFGLQFHPESILTESGERMINNFIQN